MEAIETRLRVRYAETDQMGVVYHANYFVWMEMGRVELCRSRGVSYREMEAREGILLAVVDAQCRYVWPARYDDEVLVRAAIEKAHPKMVRFAYEMLLCGSGQLLAHGQTTHIFLNREMKPARLPEKYFDLFGVGR